MALLLKKQWGTNIQKGEPIFRGGIYSLTPAALWTGVFPLSKGQTALCRQAYTDPVTESVTTL